MWESLLLYSAGSYAPEAGNGQPCVMAVPPACSLQRIPGMASGRDSDSEPAGPEEEEEEGPDVKAVQAHYLRSPSPSR